MQGFLHSLTGISQTQEIAMYRWRHGGSGVRSNCQVTYMESDLRSDPQWSSIRQQACSGWSQPAEALSSSTPHPPVKHHLTLLLALTLVSGLLSGWYCVDSLTGAIGLRFYKPSEAVHCLLLFSSLLAPKWAPCCVVWRPGSLHLFPTVHVTSRFVGSC